MGAMRFTRPHALTKHHSHSTGKSPGRGSGFPRYLLVLLTILTLLAVTGRRGCRLSERVSVPVDTPSADRSEDEEAAGAGSGGPRPGSG